MSRTKFKKGDVVQYTGMSPYGCTEEHKGKLGVVSPFDDDQYVRVKFFNWCDGAEYNQGRGWGAHPENLELICRAEDMPDDE
jgi:predicted metalloprotease